MQRRMPDSLKRAMQRQFTDSQLEEEIDRWEGLLLEGNQRHGRHKQEEGHLEVPFVYYDDGALHETGRPMLGHLLQQRELDLHDHRLPGLGSIQEDDGELHALVDAYYQGERTAADAVTEAIFGPYLARFPQEEHRKLLGRSVKRLLDAYGTNKMDNQVNFIAEHSLHVGQILATVDAPLDELIGGLFHDYFEDYTLKSDFAIRHRDLFMGASKLRLSSVTLGIGEEAKRAFWQGIGIAERVTIETKENYLGSIDDIEVPREDSQEAWQEVRGALNVKMADKISAQMNLLREEEGHLISIYNKPFKFIRHVGKHGYALLLSRDFLQRLDNGDLGMVAEQGIPEEERQRLRTLTGQGGLHMARTYHRKIKNDLANAVALEEMAGKQLGGKQRIMDRYWAAINSFADYAVNAVGLCRIDTEGDNPQSSYRHFGQTLRMWTLLTLRLDRDESIVPDWLMYTEEEQENTKMRLGAELGRYIASMPRLASDKFLAEKQGHEAKRGLLGPRSRKDIAGELPTYANELRRNMAGGQFGCKVALLPRFYLPIKSQGVAR